MKKIAVFGNAGGGKSTLARQLSELTGLPLIALDKIQFQAGGAPVAHAQFLTEHHGIVSSAAWIIDGYGCRASAWARFEAADTLVYLDLPLYVHAWWVTKRFFKGLFNTPEGWPERSPMLKSTLNSYRILWLCHRHLTPAYRALVVEAKLTKAVHHLTSSAEIAHFLTELRLAKARRARSV
jgi:adenylate kinase family enzyme